MHSCTTSRVGLWNSSIGVPMVMMTGPDVEIPAGRVAENQAVALQCLRQQSLAAILDERQASGFQRLQHLAVDVIDVDAEARLGECQHQRDADVATAADDRQVRRLRYSPRHSGSLRAGKIHALRSTTGSLPSL